MEPFHFQVTTVITPEAVPQIITFLRILQKATTSTPQYNKYLALRRGGGGGEEVCYTGGNPYQYISLLYSVIQQFEITKSKILTASSCESFSERWLTRKRMLLWTPHILQLTPVIADTLGTAIWCP